MKLLPQPGDEQAPVTISVATLVDLINMADFAPKNIHCKDMIIRVSTNAVNAARSDYHTQTRRDQIERVIEGTKCPRCKTFTLDDKGNCPDWRDCGYEAPSNSPNLEPLTINPAHLLNSLRKHRANDVLVQDIAARFVPESYRDVFIAGATSE